MRHPAGKVLTSDWSINNFIMVVNKIFFKVRSEFSVQGLTKHYSQRQQNSYTNYLQISQK